MKKIVISPAIPANSGTVVAFSCTERRPTMSAVLAGSYETAKDALGKLSAAQRAAVLLNLCSWAEEVDDG